MAYGWRHLSNILLDKLDRFVATVLIPKYTKGVSRQGNPEYRRLMNKARTCFKQGHVDEGLQLRKRAQELPTGDVFDPNYRRLKYVRYADDFLLGFIGPRSEAEEIKQQLEEYLREELKLELSKTKTLITHARSEAARFLGYEVTTLQENTKRTLGKDLKEKRSVNGRVGLLVPKDVLQNKCERYQKDGKTIHRAELLNESDFTIIATYQLEFRGIAEYYRLAYNMHSLSQLKRVMEISLTKTLAHKHKMSVGKVYQTFQAELRVGEKTYKGLQVIIPRDGKKPLVATWGGIPLIWDIQANLEDQPMPAWGGRSELEKRLLAQVCELCGATNLTDKIEVHHIRALKDLNKYPGRDKPAWVKMMGLRRVDHTHDKAGLRQGGSEADPVGSRRFHDYQDAARRVACGEEPELES